MYVPKIKSINSIKSQNEIADVVRTCANPTFSGTVDGTISKGQYLIHGKSVASEGFNRTVSFDFIENDGYVTIVGGKVRIHGKRIINVPTKDITITGGTILNPSYTYIHIILPTWVAEIDYSLTEPTSNNSEINIPLQSWSAEYREGKYYYTYIQTWQFGDVQFSNIIAE